jgi:hypothetical protein
MNSKNQNFDNRLAELKNELSKIQKEIKQVEEEKDKHLANNAYRKEFLLQNSIPLTEARIEKYDQTYFIVVKDDKFEYVVRLTKDQAAYLADELDHELNKELIDALIQREVVGNMFNPLFFNVNEKHK